MSEKTTLFVVKIFNAKRDGYIEHLFRAESKAHATANFVEVRKASADDVAELLKAK